MAWGLRTRDQRTSTPDKRRSTARGRSFWATGPSPSQATSRCSSTIRRSTTAHIHNDGKRFYMRAVAFALATVSAFAVLGGAPVREEYS